MPAAEELKGLKVGACEDPSDNGALYQGGCFLHICGLVNAKQRNWLGRQPIKALSILYEWHIAPTPRPMKH